MQRRNAEDVIKKVLANTSLFCTLDAEQRDRIIAASTVIRAPRNACIANQGEASNGIYVIIYGEVELYFQNRDGNRKTMAILGADHCFGLAETILQRPHLSAARTISDAMVIHTSGHVLYEMARECFPFALGIMACAAHQSHCLTREVERHSFESAFQRLMGYLLRQHRRQSSPVIELHASKSTIASRLGIAGGTFSRMLRDLCLRGVIEVRGRRIRIVDAGKLEVLRG
ncbi:MAG TPA: Crp/Fnr family transcriptional regulator [Noviherbaspirillum sp.]